MILKARWTSVCWTVVFLAAALPGLSQEQKTISLGGLFEANANTRHGYGLAGGLTLDYGFTGSLAGGLKLDFGSDFYAVSSFEALAFGRLYVLKNLLPYPLFVQLDGGYIRLFEGDRSASTILAGGQIGIRFPVKRFYTEQYIRFGWPTGFGLGIIVGGRFDLKSPARDPAEPPPVPVPEPVPEPPPEEAPPEPVPPGDPEPETAVEAPLPIEIIFYPYASDFSYSGEDWEPLMEYNQAALREAAYFLLAHPRYTVEITGYANPVLGTTEEETTALLPLSERRARFIKDYLTGFGVDPSRISARGSGGGRASSSAQRRSAELNFIGP
jgi:outer membrane protein OmpA-like peptidoglycan-associated protein